MRGSVRSRNRSLNAARAGAVLPRSDGWIWNISSAISFSRPLASALCPLFSDSRPRSWRSQFGLTQGKIRFTRLVHSRTSGKKMQLSKNVPAFHSHAIL